jgi:hypothetical protein
MEHFSVEVRFVQVNEVAVHNYLLIRRSLGLFIDTPV